MITLSLERASFERVPYGPKSKIQREMVVRFLSVEARDLVKGSARNLASLGQDYGVRHELPDFLKTAMKDLQSLSYELKQKFTEARRNVRFDDDNMDLVLDFTTGEGEPWKRISSKQARARRRLGSGAGSERVIDDAEIEEILGAPSGRDRV